MIDHVTLLLLVVATVWFVAGFYFQYAVRPFLHDVARFEIFAARDRLRRAAITGHVDSHSFSYGYVERMLNNMVLACSWFSFSTLVEYVICRDKPFEKTADMLRFENEASPPLRKLERDALRHMSLSLLANSLGWMFVAAVVYSVSRFRKWFLGIVELRSRHFWHDDRAMMLHT